MEIQLAESDEDVRACFPVMKQLRQHLVDEASFLQRVREQQQGGYLLAFLSDGGAPLAVAGFRFNRNLAWDRHLYVDDLVTHPDARSRGCGKALLAWLADHAKAHGGVALHLDSGMERKDAHRFYEREGMTATSLHFGRSL